MVLVWVIDADFDRPLCNRPVFDLAGNLLAIPDLFDEEAGCAGEYQGADHKDGERHREDVARHDRLRSVGIEVFEVVGGDMRDTELVAKRMHAARERSLFLPPGRRRWTLESQPGGSRGRRPVGSPDRSSGVIPIKWAVANRSSRPI